MTDHLGRDDKDFAIEFGEYLAHAAELFMTAIDTDDLNVSGDTFRDHYRALSSAIYEFRKRAARAKR
jgi:hypothetical protein